MVARNLTAERNNKLKNGYKETAHMSSSLHWTGLYCDINPLEPQLFQIIFKKSVRTAKKTPHFTVAKINYLTLFKEIIAVCSQNHA
jgi:hypothetical protein